MPDDRNDNSPKGSSRDGGSRDGSSRDDKSRKERPPSRGKRMFRLASMTASVAGGYAASQVKSMFQSAEEKARSRAEQHAAAGQRMAKTLGELKGAVMKVGQMASIAADVLPREVADALKSLQKDAPPVEFSVIEDQIKEELGLPPEDIWAEFDRAPFASASIGQVHRGRLHNGQEVVIKVQYPGVDDSCDTDLAQLRLALRAGGFLRHINKPKLDELFDEIRAKLHEELDYEQEAENARYFAELHRDDDQIIVPTIVSELSTRRVLTLGYEPGVSINDLDARGFDQETRDRIGENIFRMVCDQVFKHHTIHGDPNPANFAYREDGSVVVYDYGCVKRLQPEIVSAYRDVLRGGLREDYDLVERGLIGVGARNPAGPSVEYDFYRGWRDLILTPFLSDEPFDYGRSKLHDDVIRRAPQMMKRLASFQPPVELVFLDRTVAGQYGNLCKIRARCHSLEILEPYLELEQADYSLPSN